jgi:hypothetical protein
MALTMIDLASSWLEVVELLTITRLTTKKVNGKEMTIEEEIFDESSDRISQLVDKIWLCRYPRCRYLIYDNGSEFKLHFETLCNSYGIKRKPTTTMNPQANAICERIHQVLGTMMRTSELNMADSVYPADIDFLIDNAVWAICSTYHTVLKASPGAAIFGQDMLFDIPFVADWNKIGDYRQSQTDRSNKREINVLTTITKSVIKY